MIMLFTIIVLPIHILKCNTSGGMFSGKLILHFLDAIRDKKA